MHALSYLLGAAIAAGSSATAIAYSSPNCSSFAQSTSLGAYNSSFLNTTYYARGTLNVSGISNKISFCEVYASVGYGTNDSLIFALWVPDKQYSSRFIAIGNGGEAGVINYDEMMEELNNDLGFAVAGGNAGHLASDNDAGAGVGNGAPGVYQPFLYDEDQVKAWLHNAISLLTPAAKAIIRDFYGDEPKYSYYRGCSAGGAQGFSLAEFHPDLFDGIIAGCAANWFTHLMLSFLWNAQHTNTNETTLPESLLHFIQSRVLAECDDLDGVADNIIESPLSCPFNISSLACTEGHLAKNSTCLTPSQLSAAKAIYEGPVRRDDPGRSLFPGLSLGSEGGWFRPQVSAGASNAFSIPLLQNLVYQNLSYDPATFNWGSDVDHLDLRAGPLINAINTNLSSFRNSGGKMIAFAGWADPNIAPMWSMQHVEAVTKDTLGDGATIAENDFLKLVMVPGGGHCGLVNEMYQYVPLRYELSAALVAWVETGREPNNGIKSWAPPNGDDRTRRLCTWPQVARWNGKGHVDDWESYTCE